MRRFFEDMPATWAFNDFANPNAYVKAPAEWHVVITDVIGSTKAIQEGRYKDVNAIGVASIVGVRNVIEGVSIPFIFGGDGATLLVPGEDVGAVRIALRGLKSLSKNTFSLDLRAGIVPVKDIMAAGHDLSVCRYAAAENIPQAFISGEGVKVAERWIKDPEFSKEYEVTDEEGDSKVNCKGFECRWEPIPSSNGLILSLIIEARGINLFDRNKSYSSLLDSLSEITNTFKGSCPVKRSSLQLNKRFSGFIQEARIRTKMNSKLARKWYVLTLWFKGLFRRMALSKNARSLKLGERYVNELLVNTDYQKFDEALRMVIDVPPKQTEKILRILEKFRRNNEIFYGTHTSTSALMTCAVTDGHGEHIHFIDGNDGGYTLASQQLKTQRAMTDNNN